MTAAEAGEVVLEAGEVPGDDALPLPLLLPPEVADAVALALVVELLSLQIVLLAVSRDAFPAVPGMTVPCASP